MFEDSSDLSFAVPACPARALPSLHPEAPPVYREELNELSFEGLEVVAGLDISFRDGSGDEGIAVLAVLSFPSLKVRLLCPPQPNHPDPFHSPTAPSPAASRSRQPLTSTPTSPSANPISISRFSTSCARRAARRCRYCLWMGMGGGIPGRRGVRLRWVSRVGCRQLELVSSGSLSLLVPGLTSADSQRRNTTRYTPQPQKRPQIPPTTTLPGRLNSPPTTSPLRRACEKRVMRCFNTQVIGLACVRPNQAEMRLPVLPPTPAPHHGEKTITGVPYVLPTLLSSLSAANRFTNRPSSPPPPAPPATQSSSPPATASRYRHASSSRLRVRGKGRCRSR